MGAMVPISTSLGTCQAFQKVGRVTVKHGLLLAALMQMKELSTSGSEGLVITWASPSQCVAPVPLQTFLLPQRCKERGILFRSTSCRSHLESHSASHGSRFGDGTHRPVSKFPECPQGQNVLGPHYNPSDLT